MKRFKESYDEMMGELSPEYRIQLRKDKLESGFCEYNSQINQFAFESPEKMFVVIAFVFFTMQTPWYKVVDQFPKFMKWYFESVLKKNKIVSDFKLPDIKHMMLGPNKEDMGPSQRLSYVFKVWNERKRIFNEIGQRREEPLELFIWILKNIDGLGMPKAGFLIQLITGRLGCVDSINSKLYGSDINVAVKGNLRSKGNIEKMERYIYFTDPISAILWDDWCEIVARKTYFNLSDPGAANKSKPENQIITTIDKEGNRKTQTPYFRNKGNKDSLEKEIKRIGKKSPHKVISADHYNLLKDTERYMESFKECYDRLLEEYNVSTNKKE
jgi:hypothetical protein